MRPFWLNIKQITPLLWRKQPRTHWREPSPFRKKRMQRKESTTVGWLILGAMLIVVVTLLSGCQKPLIQPCVEPAIPTQPVSQMPTRSQSYSVSVQQDFKTWQQMLINSSVTSKP